MGSLTRESRRTPLRCNRYVRTTCLYRFVGLNSSDRQIWTSSATYVVSVPQLTQVVPNDVSHIVDQNSFLACQIQSPLFSFLCHSRHTPCNSYIYRWRNRVEEETIDFLYSINISTLELLALLSQEFGRQTGNLHCIIPSQ
jgi:hypothetical protein